MTDLRTFMALAERYSSDTNALLRYMKDGGFDPYSCWYEVCDWLANHDCLELCSEIIGHEITSADDLHEEEPEMFFKLPDNIQHECGKDCIEWLMQHNPVEAPSTAHMDLNRQKLLPRETWLIHFSNNADQIAMNGFKYGIDQMDRLGLTTYFNDSAKEYGGYNFAFLAGGRYARNAASQRKYGRHAVIFQNSGVEVSHHGDEEIQVIFHGTDVDPRGIVYLENEDGNWQVMTKRSPKVRNSGRPVFRGDFDQCEAWVMKHFAQYRKALTGF